MEKPDGYGSFEHFFASDRRRLMSQAYLLSGSLKEGEDLAYEALSVPRGTRHGSRTSRILPRRPLTCSVTSQSAGGADCELGHARGGLPTRL